MFSFKHSIHSILIRVFIFTNILFSQTVARAESLPDSQQDIALISSVDSTFYMKFLYPLPEPLIVYADTLILPTEALPFIFNKNRIDLFPLTPPLCQKHYYFSLEEKFLPDKLFRDKYNRYYLYKKTYNEIVDNHKELIRYTKEDLAGEVEQISEIKPNILQHLFKIEYDRETINVDIPTRYDPGRIYWVWRGNHFLQFSQTDDSKNWDNPGLGSINLLSTHSFNGTYQKDRLKMTQSLEWRLNLANNPNDTLRWYRISEDRLRSYTTVGFQAIKKWSYSSNMEFTTRVVPNFAENRKVRLASFLSPFQMNAGLGMNYTLNKSYPNKKYPKLFGRKVVFMADISPLSVQYVNLLRSVENPSQFGIKEGGSQLDFGATLNAKLTVNFSKSVSYMTRFKYFTNYHRVDSEWEHDLNLPINRYFSMRLYLFITFDDAREKDPKFGHAHIKETFSFGFNYAW